MALPDVARLVSFVEERDYYTEDEEIAIRAMARVNMPPWVVAAKMRQWMATGMDVTQSAKVAVRAWCERHPENIPPEYGGETVAARYQREMRERYGQWSGGNFEGGMPFSTFTTTSGGTFYFKMP